MEWSQEIFFTAFLIAAAAIHGVHGYGLITGNVFCDQCKDGQVSLFDYPLNGNIYNPIAFSCSFRNS